MKYPNWEGLFRKLGNIFYLILLSFGGDTEKAVEPLCLVSRGCKTSHINQRRPMLLPTTLTKCFYRDIRIYIVRKHRYSHFHPPYQIQLWVTMCSDTCHLWNSSLQPMLCCLQERLREHLVVDSKSVDQSCIKWVFSPYVQLWTLLAQPKAMPLAPSLDKWFACNLTSVRKFTIIFCM